MLGSINEIENFASVVHEIDDDIRFFKTVKKTTLNNYNYKLIRGENAVSYICTRITSMLENIPLVYNLPLDELNISIKSYMNNIREKMNDIKTMNNEIREVFSNNFAKTENTSLYVSDYMDVLTITESWMSRINTAKNNLVYEIKSVKQHHHSDTLSKTLKDAVIGRLNEREGISESEARNILLKANNDISRFVSEYNNFIREFSYEDITFALTFIRNSLRG